MRTLKDYSFIDRNRLGTTVVPVPMSVAQRENSKGQKTRVVIEMGGVTQNFQTDDPAVQKFIENHPSFKGQVYIRVVKQIPEDIDNEQGPDDENSGTPDPNAGCAPNLTDIADVPDVIDFQGAVAVLRGEPYKVSHLALRTPEMLRKQAEANKVGFPNLTF